MKSTVIRLLLDKTIRFNCLLHGFFATGSAALDVLLLSSITALLSRGASFRDILIAVIGFLGLRCLFGIWEKKTAQDIQAYGNYYRIRQLNKLTMRYIQMDYQLLEWAQTNSSYQRALQVTTDSQAAFQVVFKHLQSLASQIFRFWSLQLLR